VLVESRIDVSDSGRYNVVTNRVLFGLAAKEAVAETK
jgi:hypothetical protein